MSFDKYQSPHGYALSDGAPAIDRREIMVALLGEIWSLGKLCSDLERRVAELEREQEYRDQLVEQEYWSNYGDIDTRD